MSAERRKRAEEDEAQEYAARIRNPHYNGDWRAYNEDIIDRFSVTALHRIKRRAWQIVESREQVS